MSQAIVEEALRALNYPKVRKYIRSGLDPELWFEDIVILSHVVAEVNELVGATNDPDDDKYIAAAIEGRARFIVAVRLLRDAFVLSCFRVAFLRDEAVGSDERFLA